MRKTEGNTFRVKRLAGLSALICVLVMSTVIQASAISTKTQSSWCLFPSDFTSTVKNKDFHVKEYKYGYGKKNAVNYIKTSKSDNRRVTFKTRYLLPTKYVSQRWGNPQSMTMDNETGYLYVLYTVRADSSTGWIVRYDTRRLAEYKISYKQLATATKSGNSALDKKLKRCIKYGPKFTTGHGQSLSFNPVTGELWEIKDTTMNVKPGSYATLQRINTSTLKPDAAIKFRLKSSVAMGHNLTFDSEGNAYFFTYSGSGKWKGSVKIYKGWISKDSVNFELIPQGLKHNPGPHSQGMGYDEYRNRIVLVADGCIVSVPVDKLGELKPGDVWQTNFKTKREFENVTFDKDGYMYLISNRDPELFRSTEIY
ncbi:MAG: hypothetical protein LBL54_03590 [Clostridiales Family XIII bacterium]|jgi:hypothetical protein|nr:hypothetical protein [Clostridiales Family XIII bacterium]